MAKLIQIDNVEEVGLILNKEEHLIIWTLLNHGVAMAHQMKAAGRLTGSATEVLALNGETALELFRVVNNERKYK